MGFVSTPKHIDNVIRIQSGKNITNYFEAIVLRSQPRIYDKYGCVKLRFTRDLKTSVSYLCQLFWHFGLVVETIYKLEDGIVSNRGTVISEAYEVVLKKIGATVSNDEEYASYTKDNWEKVR